MDTFTLHPSNQRPLKFTGEMLAEITTHHYQGPRNTRWHEAKLYRTKNGTLVLAIWYRTQWEGESDHTSVMLGKDADAILEQFGEDEIPQYVLDLFREAELDIAELVP